MSPTNLLQRFDEMLSALSMAMYHQLFDAPGEKPTPLIEANLLEMLERISDYREELICAALSLPVHLSPCDMGRIFDRIYALCRQQIDTAKTIWASDTASLAEEQARRKEYVKGGAELARAREPIRELMRANTTLSDCRYTFEQPVLPTTKEPVSATALLIGQSRTLPRQRTIGAP